MYKAQEDTQFLKPFIDIEEWREGDLYYYLHGGFEDTDLKFSFFFPKKEAYKGRFFHFMSPVQGHEDAAIGRTGEEDRIGFALSHGAYFVETNMGVAPFSHMADPTIIYRASAAAAEFSRTVAVRLFGEHRPYGYIYGGSGGGFKSTSCFENTATWDGAVPYVIGSSMAIPNSFTIRAYAKRVLRRKMQFIADAVEPGGGDIYANLNEEEKAALIETIDFGFPLKCWVAYKDLDDGALPLFIPMIKGSDALYFTDFWEKNGYAGADQNSSAVKDRVQLQAKIKQIHIPGVTKINDSDKMTGVDEAWKRSLGAMQSKPWIEIDVPLDKDMYLSSATITFTDEDGTAFSTTIESVESGMIFLAMGFDANGMVEKLSKLKIGSEVVVDNSDYIAIQYYHRHQVPDSSYGGWNCYRNADGTPKYPQRNTLFGKRIAYGGCGSLQSGSFSGKMIAVAALMDESALPWQADWYRNKVKQIFGDKEADCFRLWYVENAFHGDSEITQDELHLVSYLGILHQALLDVSDWVERGIVPAESTGYVVKNGLVTAADNAKSRKGIQPIIKLTANGLNSIVVKCGEPISFNADIEMPNATDKIEVIEWSFNSEQNFPYKGKIDDVSECGLAVSGKYIFSYDKPGTYFPTVRIMSNRNPGDAYTKIRNLSRMRVTVK